MLLVECRNLFLNFILMGAPEKFTTEQIIEALHKTNGLITLAADRLGCSAKTIYNRAKQVKSVQDAIEYYRTNLIDHAELALRSAVLSKEPWAVAMVLKTLGKHRGYVERQEVTGADGGAIVVEWDDSENNDKG